MRLFATSSAAREAGAEDHWIRKGLPAEVRQIEPEDGGEIYEFDFVITGDAKRDRYNDLVSTGGWTWENYFLGGPGPVLWAHNSWQPPIARCPAPIRRIESAIVARCIFPRPEEIGYEEGQPHLARTVRLMLLNKFLKACSVGFMPLEWTWDDEEGGYNFLRQELYEWSIVPVPAYPGAYMLDQMKGVLPKPDVAPLLRWCEETLSADRGPGVWMPRDVAQHLLDGMGAKGRGSVVIDGSVAKLAAKAPPAASPSTSQAAATPEAATASLLLQAAVDLVRSALPAAPIEAPQPKAQKPAVVKTEPAPPFLVVDLAGPPEVVGFSVSQAEIKEAVRAAFNEQTVRTGQVF
jgi:hypothetical protein